VPRPTAATLAAALVLAFGAAAAGAAPVHPVRARRGMVASQNALASEAGRAVLIEGGTAVDAAVATAFVLSVTHPTAGNIGGGGFLLLRTASGEAVAYDFRETAPTGSHPRMFLDEQGRYDRARHHDGHAASGVPGSVAGLHLAWREHGRLPWPRLVTPAIAFARDGFVVTEGLARTLGAQVPVFNRYPASRAQFTKDGKPYAAGDLLRQPHLARTLERIAAQGPAGFYEGETARLIEAEMTSAGGLITAADLRAYAPRKRAPLRGTYRGYGVLGMPPVSSGGVTLQIALNILEGYDLRARGFGSAAAAHLIAEAMRRAYADRARYLGDPDFVPDLPLARLLSKEHAAGLRSTIDETRASASSPASFEWRPESSETTHVSVVDEARNAVALTTTLEDEYGSRIVVPGAGFLLNNEMGDFNAGPGLTDAAGLVGTEPNLAQPGKRMLSSMTPTLLEKDGSFVMAMGSLGGRTIINTVLLTVVNVVDFGLNVQEAIDAPRFHHQWLPDRILYERLGLSPDTLELLRAKGHVLFERPERDGMGCAQGIVLDPATGVLEGGSDRRRADGAALGY
jgi:gamma-glutamyltranspeptidase/glutathione hydrolase